MYYLNLLYLHGRKVYFKGPPPKDIASENHKTFVLLKYIKI